MHLASYFAYALGFTWGPWEIGLILVAVVIMFGGKKLPGLARAMGSSITQFKKGLKDDSSVEELTDSSKGEDAADEGGPKEGA